MTSRTMISRAAGRVGVVGLLVLWLPCVASVRAEINASGVRQLPSSTVQRWLGEIGPRPVEEIARRAQERYRQEGFFDAVVTVARTGEQDGLILLIDEGAPVTFGEVAVRLPGGFDGEFIQTIARSLFSGLASMQNIERGISEILRQLVDAGYSGAQVSPLSFRRDGNRLSFFLDVVPGSAAHVGSWRISGLQRCDTARVRKLLDLRPGAAWNLAEKARIEERIQQFEYLSLAGEIRTVAQLTDSLVDVEIPLAERPAVVTDGALGLAGGGDGSQSVRGRMNLTVENPFGDGRRLELFLDRPSGNLAESRVRLSDPHLAGSWIGVRLDVQQFRQSRTYDRVSLATQGSAYVGHACEVQLQLGWSKITPLTRTQNAYPARCYDIALSAQKNRPPQAMTSANGHWNWQLGIAASFRREFRSTAEGQGIAASRARVILAMERTWPLAQRIELHLAGKTESWLGPDADLGWGDELYLGGPETVRGFAERSLNARGFAILNSEVGYRPLPQLTAFLFSDLALFRPFAPGNTERTIHRATGYGFGLETLGRLGRTRLEVGWPEGRSLGDGMMYLRWLRGW